MPIFVDPRLSQVVPVKPFVEISNMTRDLSLGVVKFTDETNEITYKMPYKIEQYNSLSDLEKEHMKSVLEERGGQEKMSRVRDEQDIM
nr:retrotransposon Orf1 [Tanacetum cinerariifolium]